MGQSNVTQRATDQVYFNSSLIFIVVCLDLEKLFQEEEEISVVTRQKGRESELSL